MAGRKRRRGKTRLTIVNGHGKMRSARAPRRDSPTSIDGLPTRVYFTRGSSTPTSTSLTVLRKYAQWLARSRARKLFVVGHANRRNWAEASAALADARVRAVRDLLVWLGAGRKQVRRVSPARLHRIRPGSTSAERATHRYVELIVGSGGQPNVQVPVPRRRRPSLRRAA